MVMQDCFWQAVVDFLRSQYGHTETIVAPKEFANVLTNVTPYEEKHAPPPDWFDWAVVHKGMMEELGREWFERLFTSFRPAYANEVFVIFSKKDLGNPELMKSAHVIGFFENLKRLTNSKRNTPMPREARSAIYLGDHKALTRTVHEHKMYVDTRDKSLAPHILLDGYWENWVTEVFLANLAPGMTVVDIGANIGYYSLLAAAHIGPAGRLYCFEANPNTADLLFSNLEINGYLDRAQVLSKAVYSKSTQIQFNCFEKHQGGSSIWVDEMEVREGLRDNLEKITVDTVSLDEFFAPGTRVDLIKVDAEGAEPYILQGAKRVLEENRNIRILMEFNLAQLQRSLWLENAYKKLVDEIRELGFTIYLIEHDGVLHEATPDALSDRPVSDVLLKRPQDSDGSSATRM